MRQFAGKAFHFLSDRIFHATEVLPGERAVRPLLSGKFVCYAGPSGFQYSLYGLAKGHSRFQNLEY